MSNKVRGILIKPEGIGEEVYLTAGDIREAKTYLDNADVELTDVNGEFVLLSIVDGMRKGLPYNIMASEILAMYAFIQFDAFGPIVILGPLNKETAELTEIPKMFAMFDTSSENGKEGNG